MPPASRSRRRARWVPAVALACVVIVVLMIAVSGSSPPSTGYIYGEQRAAHSYGLVATPDPIAAKTAPWWLDVELMASWAGTYQLNIAALQGFIAGLSNAGASGPIGIYSTSAQWKEITG